MESTLTLYKNSAILPQRNFMVDDIEEYLSTLESLVISKYQYQKIAFDMVFKVDINQSTQEFFDVNNYNYAKLVNQDGNIIYFFIGDKQQRAAKTIAFVATMDTVNTAKPGVNFEVSNRTHINRQHKDRFIPSGNTTALAGSNVAFPTEYDESKSMYYQQLRFIIPVTNKLFKVDADFSEEVQRDREIKGYIDYTTNELVVDVWDERPNEGDMFTYFVRYYSQLRRVIDEYSEGLTPILYKRDSVKLKHEVDENWYLVYRNRLSLDDNPPVNPVDCYVVPEYPKDVLTSVGKAELNDTDLTATYTYFDWYLTNNTVMEFEFIGYDSNDNQVIRLSLLPEYVEGNISELQVVRLEKLNGSIKATTFIVLYNLTTRESEIYTLGEATIAKAVLDS